MAQVCPTVLATTTEDFRVQMETIESFAERIQIDLGDNRFTKTTIDLKDVWWPSHVEADIHLMYQRPSIVLPELIAQQPGLVIIHAEAEGDHTEFAQHLKSHGIQFGVALLQNTHVAMAQDLIKLADHVLIFSGNLGSFGGKADLSLLAKVPQIRAINPQVEIGWDGGINAENIAQLVRGGIDVLNVGGAIQKAMQPKNAFRNLVRRAET